MLQQSGDYHSLTTGFNWSIPEKYNIAVDVCDKWAAQPDRLALICLDETGAETRYTFARLKELSNRLANGLKAQGLARGERLGILLSQGPEAALSHLAAYKLGAVAIPLFTLFGPEALAYRLGNSRARAVVTDEANLTKILEIRDQLEHLELIILTSGRPPGGVLSFQELIERGSVEFSPADTGADAPALIIYTSGTTGPPKGALHAHRVLLGHLPGVELPHNFFPQADDLFWTPADWAWIGGLIDVLLPAWHHGVPVLAHRAAKFDPEQAFELMARYRVRNVFMPPTALKLMRQVKNPAARWDYALRSVGSGGETLGEELLDWGRQTLNLTINEFYGQTEANLIVCNCAQLMEVRAGSMGRPVPGHRVAVVDEDGRPLPPGQTGQVAVARPDPVMFLGYWENQSATRAKFIGDWCLTGDLAKTDADGYLWFVGRTDDVITSAGYRIGPAEVEDCLLKHPAVSLAAVIGKPDAVRTELVKAFIVPAQGFEPAQGLAAEIQAFVKTRLAAHEYPREIEFVTNLPLTATGKIIRKQLRQLEAQRVEKTS